jgi:hypothetical protein
MSKMYPNPAAETSFKYPSNHLLPLQGVIPENELCFPQMYDANSDKCLIEIKNGHTTGITIGYTTSVKSFVREYFRESTVRTSM